MPKFLTNYPWSVSVEQMVAEMTAQLEATRYYGDAFPRWWLNFGPGMLAGWLGAHVHSVPETVWFSPRERRSAAELHFQPDWGNRWWRRVEDLTRVATAAWGQAVQVSHADIGGNLDVIASFRTTEGLLFDLYDAPEEVDRLVGEVTRAWLACYDALDRIIRPACRGTTPWAPIWSPRRTYMLQSDFAYMISPAMFERFVLPDLAACCDHLDDGFYHLDGPGQIPHVDLLLGIARLRGIQWIPGDGNPPPDQWLDLLKRIIDGGKLCQIYCTAAGALHVVRHLGGKGFSFAISDEMRADEAQAFLRQLAREDIARR
ncbi:MAG: hypothetical protein V1772_06360 [Chloroflexota bacterium]